MKFLLDTHVFLWMAEAPYKLTQKMQESIQDPQNLLFLSVVSVWEMQIKSQVGKLHLPLPIHEFVTVQRAINQIHTLPVMEGHIWELGKLPLSHKDPFDRLLIAQAIVENCQLVTADTVFTQYPVRCLGG